MTTTETPDTYSVPVPEGAPAAPPVSNAMLFDSGQWLWLAIVTVIALLALVLAAIALLTSDGGGGVAAPPPAASDQVAVSGTDFAFDPADVAVPGATEATVDFTNDGGVEHNWTVLSEEIASEEEYDPSLDLFTTGNVVAGESASVAVTLDAGTYQVICTVPGHFAAGMVGSITAS